MPIGNYLKVIGRGKEGARSLSREDAADMFGQILDRQVSDLEIGAFCLAMRIKGEAPQEMAGFLDATHARIRRIVPGVDAAPGPLVLLPSYNGARRLPLLTPLLALLLARAGLAVVMHGAPTESARVFTTEVLEQLDIRPCEPEQAWGAAGVRFVSTKALHPGLQSLLDARRLIQLRNPAHSLVKLMTPCDGPSVLVSSYTHPEYALSMREVLQCMQTNAMLLRGTEGEAVADARRTPVMTCFLKGKVQASYEAQPGSIADVPNLPTRCDAISTAQYIRAVLDGSLPIPEPIALQVQRVVDLCASAR